LRPPITSMRRHVFGPNARWNAIMAMADSLGVRGDPPPAPRYRRRGDAGIAPTSVYLLVAIDRVRVADRSISCEIFFRGHRVFQCADADRFDLENVARLDIGN